MELADVVGLRRSVRAFKAETDVNKETVEDIIKFAQNAPSWKNSQTGRYYVVLTPEKVKEVKEKCLPKFNQENVQNAPALIVTAFVKTRSGFDREGNAVNECGNEWGAYDLGLQSQLLILKARELGFDTLIMGIRDGAALREALGIDENEEVMSVIALGHRAEEPAMPPRKTLEHIARFS